MNRNHHLHQTDNRGPSSGVRKEAEGALNSALCVCSQPKVLQSGTAGRSE